jgi:hypothetical protein
MRKLAPMIVLVACMAFCAAALAAVAVKGSGSLSSKTPRQGSGLNVNTGPFPSGATLPSAMSFTLQKGFSTSSSHGVANSVATFCATSDENVNNCPAASEIGSGTMQVTPNGNLFGTTGEFPVSLTFFAAQPTQSGCPASVDLVVTLIKNSSDQVLAFPTEHAIGNLCTHGGGVQISFPSLPDYSYYTQGTSITVSNLTASFKSSNTVGGKVKSLISNPPSCPKAKKWTGAVSLTLSGGPATAPLKLACKK